MERIEQLLEESRHVEFVEQLNELDDKIRKAREKGDRNMEEKFKSEKRGGMQWCENYVKNKEIPQQERKLIDLSCVLGVYLAKKRGALKTTQIRKMLDRFNSIESDRDNFDKSALIKLKPILAYTAARNKPTGELVRILDGAISKVSSVEDFRKICEFLRGVVAYHKLAGGE